MLRLDRMAIEEAGPDPTRMAEAALRQLGAFAGPIPIEEVARALDIAEIRTAPLQSIEGALLTDAERDIGSILLNAASSLRRRRFTLAHELLHFLNPLHRPVEPGRFACRPGDLATGWSAVAPTSLSIHHRQEMEANRFAIELLAPTARFRRYRRMRPDLAQVVAIADQCEISREACARRYVDLASRPVAIVFSERGLVRYVARHPEFPYVPLARGEALPLAIGQTDRMATVEPDAPGPVEDADPADWLGRSRAPLVVQRLAQQQGFAMTLLALDDQEE